VVSHRQRGELGIQRRLARARIVGLLPQPLLRRRCLRAQRRGLVRRVPLRLRARRGSRLCRLPRAGGVALRALCLRARLHQPLLHGRELRTKVVLLRREVRHTVCLRRRARCASRRAGAGARGRGRGGAGAGAGARGRGRRGGGAGVRGCERVRTLSRAARSASSRRVRSRASRARSSSASRAAPSARASPRAAASAASARSRSSSPCTTPLSAPAGLRV